MLQTSAAARHGRITLRSILLGIVLVLLISIGAPYNDYVAHNTPAVGNHLPVTIIAVIAVLCLLINPLLGRRRFTTAEMATAIAMMVIACGLPTSGWGRYFHAQLGGIVFQSVGTQEWQLRYISSVPDWLLPGKDPRSPIIRDYFFGVPPTHSLWETWRPWLIPYLAWAFYLVPMLLIYLLLSALMRKQWVERERLPFPLAVVPLEMMAPPEPGRILNNLWRSKALWIAVAIPFVIHLCNGTHQFFPSVPEIPTSYDYTQSVFTEYPWNVLNWNIRRNQLYFSVIGVTFLLPLDVAFSIWFFYLAYNLGVMLLARQGLDVSVQHRAFHGAGFWLVYGLLLLWLARGHLQHVLVSAWRGAPREHHEPLSYRTCVIGLLVCLALVCGFLIVAGVTPWLVPLMVGLMVLWSLVLTRMVIEAGVLLVFWPIRTERVVGWLLAKLAVGAQQVVWMKNWTLLNLAAYPLYVDPREHVMPYTADAVRMSSQVSPRHRRRHFLALLAALLLALAAAGVTHHLLTYTWGRGTFDGGYSFDKVPRELVATAREFAEPDGRSGRVNPPLNIAGAGSVMVALAVVRALTTALPLHPIGLLLLNTFAADRMWYSIMIAWALKVVLLRWGGAGIYTRAKYFFIGLLVGESLAGVFWNIIGLCIGWPDPARPYQILPA